MTTISLSNKIELSALKQAYLEALASYKNSKTDVALVRLNAIKETYVSFKVLDE